MPRAELFGSVLLLLLLQTIRSTLAAEEGRNNSALRTPDLCDLQALDVENVTVYSYKNTTGRNCGCANDTISKCFRKCCAIGYHATKGKCIRSESDDFTVPIYKNRRLLRNVSLGDGDGLLVGTPKCSYFAIRPSVDNISLELQEDGRLWTDYYDFFGNEEYCVDLMAGFGLSVLVCFRDPEEMSREVGGKGSIVVVAIPCPHEVDASVYKKNRSHSRASMHREELFGPALLLLLVMVLTPPTAASAEGLVDHLDLCDLRSLVKNVTTYRYANRTLENCGCAEDLAKCFRKCCAVGYYASRGVCIKGGSENFTFPVYRDQRFLRNVAVKDGLLVGPMACEFFPLRPSVENVTLRLQEDGRLWTDVFTYEYVDNDNYCVDYLDDFGLSAFVCIKDDVAEDISREINVSGMIISMPFLLATFIAYALLPDRNLHMKALMSYVINLMFGYLLLVIIQLSQSKFGNSSCITIGYFCLFFFMVSFFWMNVICIDIWFAFSGLRGFSGTKNAERRRFLWYCLYAWGMSILHVLIVFAIDKTSSKNAWFNPGIGNGQCFVKLGYAELLYFYGPMGVLISINVVFFATTAFRIRAIKKDTSMLKKDDSKRHSYENDKQKFNLYLKLLFAMGVNWSLEIISWAVNWKTDGHIPAYIWYLTDFCNAIYGVFIFFIFVFKRSIWKLLKKRYYSFVGKPYLAHSMTQNQTRATSMSTTTNSHHGGVVTDSSVLTSEA